MRGVILRPLRRGHRANGRAAPTRQRPRRADDAAIPRSVQHRHHRSVPLLDNRQRHQRQSRPPAQAKEPITASGVKQVLTLHCHGWLASLPAGARCGRSLRSRPRRAPPRGVCTHDRRDHHLGTRRPRSARSPRPHRSPLGARSRRRHPGARPVSARRRPLARVRRTSTAGSEGERRVQDVRTGPVGHRGRRCRRCRTAGYGRGSVMPRWDETPWVSAEKRPADPSQRAVRGKAGGKKRRRTS
jgi:hypothetical protein